MAPYLSEDIATRTSSKNKYTAWLKPPTKPLHLTSENPAPSAATSPDEPLLVLPKGDNRFDCIRKGGNMCFAMAGENRYHSIFGAIKACVAVNPSDTAPALVALNAKIVTTKQTIDAENFWDVAIPGSTVLAKDEIVKEIQIPTPASGTKTAFLKFALRSSIDFPIVNCAAAISGSDARICLNAVYNKPYRATKAEEAIKGKTIDEASAETAGTAAVSGAVALSKNKWKIQVAKTMVKRAILACK